MADSPAKQHPFSPVYSNSVFLKITQKNCESKNTVHATNPSDNPYSDSCREQSSAERIERNRFKSRQWIKKTLPSARCQQKPESLSSFGFFSIYFLFFYAVNILGNRWGFVFPPLFFVSPQTLPLGNRASTILPRSKSATSVALSHCWKFLP